MLFILKRSVIFAVIVQHYDDDDLSLSLFTLYRSPRPAYTLSFTFENICCRRLYMNTYLILHISTVVGRMKKSDFDAELF